MSRCRRRCSSTPRAASAAASSSASSSISSPSAGRAALVLGMLSIAWGSILARLSDSPPLTVAFLRLLLAAMLIAPWGLRAVAWRSLPSLRRLPIAAGAGVLLALHFVAWVPSLARTTIAASTLMVSTQPIFSILISTVALRERPAPRTWLAVALAFSGVLLIAAADLGSGPDHLSGDLLALLGAVFAAAYFVCGRALRGWAPFPTYLLVINLAAALCAGGVACAAGAPLLPASRADLGWLILMALVPHLLGHGALNWAVRRLRAYVVNLAVLGEPVLASLLALLIFHESPPPGLLPGALLVGAGVALAVAWEGRGE
ncbi:MAG TPA: DMT family transporter [Candidatus Polarisedimenticolia bacterium]|nr:DMT family transporter [Candidatus Polarisedimenticolia bacterium]